LLVWKRFEIQEMPLRIRPAIFLKILQHLLQDLFMTEIKRDAAHLSDGHRGHIVFTAKSRSAHVHIGWHAL
jgi:hypothetical protein